MGGCFYVVLNMSVTATLIGLIVAAIRLPLRRRAALASYALWAFVFLRLLLPFSLPSEASALNAVSRYVLRIASYPVRIPANPAATGFTSLNSMLLVDDPSLYTTNFIGAVNGLYPTHFKTGEIAAVFHAAGAVWLAGSLLCLAALGALYALTAMRFARALPSPRQALLQECAAAAGVRRKVRLCVSDGVSTPVVFGLLRPKVVIPSALEGDAEALRYALLHELVHVRRGDNLIRAASAALACIHWFNPFAWLFLALSGRDMELACDAGVLKRLSEAGRREYAHALLGLAAGRQPALASAFGRGTVRERIVGIMKYRRLTSAAAAIIGCLLFLLAVVLLTNPAA